MAKAIDYVFERPSVGISVSVLFKTDISKSDWGRELIHNLMVFPLLLLNAYEVPTNFSDKFVNTPELLYELKKTYLKKEKKEANKPWHYV